ncbi:sterile alpha motif domain-containing protein 1-like [Lutra lutra]|uniref:sterile alpha motif domain-containing protein 1-like n=1 Tax=Lutra lutra TaxID=9657 RepID=UPI001FD3742F|nr:sterile alpha motif domain-containing protein 1-like [Lutra lutra]
MIPSTASECGDPPGTAPQRALLSKRSGEAVDPRALRGAHLSGQGFSSEGGRGGGPAPSRAVLDHGRGLPRSPAGGERIARPSPCASRGRDSLQKPKSSQPGALLRSTLGGSLGPAASRAPFPAPRPRAQVSPHSSLPPAGRSRACGSPAPGPALPSSALPPFPPAPPSLRRAGAPGLASPSPSHLRPPSSPRVAIFSKSSARRHRLSSQLAAVRTALPSSPPRGGRDGGGASRTPRSAHRAGPAAPAALTAVSSSGACRGCKGSPLFLQRGQFQKLTS